MPPWPIGNLLASGSGSGSAAAAAAAVAAAASMTALASGHGAMPACDGGLSASIQPRARILPASSPASSDANGPSIAGSVSAAYPPAIPALDGIANGQEAVLAKDGSDDSTNPLKRRNTDASVDYPRRRATIACEVCRSRKSRCDGTKPKCKLCTELGAECVYREPGIKLDAGDKLILERLGHIESLLQMNLAAATATATATAQQQQQEQQQQLQQLQTQTPTQESPSGLSNGLSTTAGSGFSAPWPEPPIAVAAAAAAAAAAATSDFVPAIPAGGIGTWSSGTNISTMPKVHTNAALHLLQWPLIRDLVAQPYDPQILLRLEMGREPLRLLTKTPFVDLSNAAIYSYVAAYFERVNVWYACVNPYTWRSHYSTALSNDFRNGPESCIVLLVLALGQASLRGSISRIDPLANPPGLPYFTAAWALLPGMMTSNSVLAAQCYLMAAAYLFYLVRPLEAWSLLCTTSTKLQLLLMAPGRVPPDQRELTERIYWNALLFESDLLAELDLPHSGVVQLEENVGLPCGFEAVDETAEDGQNGLQDCEDGQHFGGQDCQECQGDQKCYKCQNGQNGQNSQSGQSGKDGQGGRMTEQNGHHGPVQTTTVSTSASVGRDELWYFLAEIALRRLLNRVSQLIYSKDSVASTASLSPIVAELDFQLTQWYDSLPRPLQFSFSSAPLSDPVQTVLRLRFFACRTIIYRPYILAVLDHEQAVLDPIVLDPAVRAACHQCLESAVRQLEDVTSHHAGHMAYLWQCALSLTSQTLLIMGASMSPSLSAILLTIVPGRDVLDQIIADVVDEITRYGLLAPSLSLAASIISQAEARRRAYLGG